MTRRRVRHITWALVFGASAVLGSGAALQWREIAIRWRVAALERQPAESELPVDFVVAGPGTTARDALMRHLRTPAGKERLLRSYLSVFERSRTPISQCLDHVGLGGKTAVLLVWLGGTTLRAKAATDSEWMEHLRSIQDDPATHRRRGDMPLRRGMCSSIRNCGLGSSMLDMSFYARLQELVVEVGYDEHPIPGRVGARFSVVSAGAEKSCKRHYDWDFQWGSYACLIESDPHRLDPAH